MACREERIAVTGVGIASCLGEDAQATFRRLVDGERGLLPLTLFDVAGQRSELAAEVRGLRVEEVAPRGQADHWSRGDALALLAAEDALRSAGLGSGVSPLSLAIGATTGGMFEAEAILGAATGLRATDGAVRRLVSFPLSAAAERLCEALGRVERATTICSACSSGANAIVQGAAWLSNRCTDCVLAGGSDALCQLTFAGFNALGVTAPDGCRPFDVARSGLTLGEGAAFLVLERESDALRRGAHIRAWLSGWAIGSEAHHVTNPEPTGATAARLIGRALARARLDPGDLDYVNAHGTGTKHNDAMEARALCKALGAEVDRVRVSSSKGQLGHTLGAAGAIEAAVTVLAIDHAVVPPTGGLRTPDDQFPLHHVFGRGTALRVRAALSNSFGFGGTDTVLLFEHASATVRSDPESRSARVVLSAAARWGSDGLVSATSDCHPARSVTAEAAPAPSQQAASRLDPSRSRRLDALAALVITGAQRVLDDASLAADGVGLIVGTAFGNVERSVRFLQRLADRGATMVSPAEFPHLLPSAPSGNAAIYLGLSGPVLSVIDVGLDGEAAVSVAHDLLELGVVEAMVAGAVTVDDPVVTQVLDPLFCDQQSRSAEGAVWFLLETEAHARARGAEVLAAVAGLVHARCTVAEGLSAIEPPLGGRRPFVIGWGDVDDIRSALSGSAWASADLVDAGTLPACREAGCAAALAVGAARIADSTADDVLVLVVAGKRLYASHLVRSTAQGCASRSETGAGR